MLTVGIAALTLGGCTALRWLLDRPYWRDAAHWQGRVRLRTLWNRGAAFDLPIPRPAVTALSAVALTGLWRFRRQRPVSTGLVLGGGLSNLWERLRHGRVYDYVQFPKAPGRLREYVFNAADLAIALGALGLLCRKRRR